MNSIHKRGAALVLAVSVLLLAVIGTTYADGEVVPRFTVGGGAERVAAGNVVLRGALGQPIAGVAQSAGGSQVCTGFECGAGTAPASTPTVTATTDPSISPTPTATATTDPSVSPTPTPTATATSNLSTPPTPTPTATATATSEPSESGSSSDVVIHEVYYRGDADGDWIELKNTGSGTVDISQWYFCARFSYKQLGDNMTILQGDLSLGPDEIVVLKSWTDLDADGSGSDLAIYKDDATKADGRPSFDDPNFMVDFVQWGTPDDVGRSDVAVAKGIWAQTSTDPVRYDFVPTAASGQSLSLTSSNKGSASADFANQAPTQGTNNTSVPGSESQKLYLPAVIRR